MPSTFATRLRDARRRVRLSQTAVGGQLRLPRQTIAAFERDERDPSVRQLGMLSNLYRLTPDELMGNVRSVVEIVRPPELHARANSEKALSEGDQREVGSFYEYLQQRPGPSLPLALPREPFETVELFADRWRAQGLVKDLNGRLPVPVFEMLARHRIEVRFTSLDELAGALIPLEGVHRSGVLINCDQPTDRGRYTAGHEIGHLALGHDPRSGCETELGRRFTAPESEADQFASALLMPASTIGSVAKQATDRARGLGRERAAHVVYLMARAYMVSFAAMVTRLAGLGALNAKDVDTLKKSEKPSALAKELGVDEEGGSVPFDDGWLPEIAARAMPPGWQEHADAESVRLLQAVAFADYVTRIADDERSDSPGAVYEKVAVWVAGNYPLVLM